MKHALVTFTPLLLAPLAALDAADAPGPVASLPIFHQKIAFAVADAQDEPRSVP